MTNIKFTANEIKVLNLGLSFTPTPRPCRQEIEDDLFDFIRKIRLSYHFRDEINDFEKPLLKTPSTWCPPTTKNHELEQRIRQLMNTSFHINNRIDNISCLRHGLNTLIKRVQNNDIVIKSADKGSICVLMTTALYWEMCLRHLNNPEFYQLLPEDPSDRVNRVLLSFVEKYMDFFLLKEKDYLLNFKYKMANFYMLPKIHKSQTINDILQNSNAEFISVGTEVLLEGRPIVAGCAYYTHGISMILHKILEPSMHFIPQILKDTFDFVNKNSSELPIGTVIGVADIKGLYTNIRHDLGLKAMEYWLNNLGDSIPLMKRFTQTFILESTALILKHNYFYINNRFYHQLKGTAMGTPFAVVYANLTVAYLEITLFDRLPEIFPNDIAHFFFTNYFRFLDDVKYAWSKSIDVEPLWELFNNLDPDIKFIFESLSHSANFLDVKCSIENNKLDFDIYHKPTHSFSYIKYHSCHPRHTLNNIALSLGKRIVQIVTGNNETHLSTLKNHLKARGHPTETVNETLLKLYSPSFTNTDTTKSIVFIRTFNPSIKFKKAVFTQSIHNFEERSLQTTFKDKNILFSTRQGRNLKKLLTKARFDPMTTRVKPKEPEIGLFACSDKRCTIHTLGYIQPCKFFTFKHKAKTTTWTFNRRFDCNSKNVIYLLICRGCEAIYIGETSNLRLRHNNAKKDIRGPLKATVPYAGHINRCSQLTEPFYFLYPLFYESCPMKRKFKEWRFINRFCPQLNIKK